MEGETISVIIPAYNVAPWLPRCLDSILAQTYPKLEIIVVDDGSADSTRQVMESYAARDGRIKPIFKENGGVTSARLAGVAAATGEWVGFADGDDAIDPALARLMCQVVRYRLEHPDYLHDPDYGATLLACFRRCRDELPIGYASFHLPWLLEWHTAARQYKQAYELLRSFPIKFDF